MNSHPKNPIVSRHRLLLITGALAGLLAMSALLGAHWMVFQSIAWGRMLANYSQDNSMAVAVSKTFSGKYPCSACLQIEKGRQQEREEQGERAMLSTDKIPDFIVERMASFAPMRSLAAVPVASFVTALKTQFLCSIPKPPPRGSSTLSVTALASAWCLVFLLFPLSRGSANSVPVNLGMQGILIAKMD